MSSGVTSVRIAGACTASVLGIATIVFGTAAAVTTAGTVAMVAYATFAVLSAAASISSLTAWASDESKDVSSYFSTMGKHTLFSIPLAIQFVAQILMQALVEGLVKGVSKAVSRKIAGDDQTVAVTHKKG
ncbi:MAG TPA: hypothetical protein VGM34_01660 [Chlamydiales bacterium]